MKVKVRRAPDLPIVTRIANTAYTKEFSPEEKEFVLDVSELPHVLHDGNMEFVEYIEGEGEGDEQQEREQEKA